MDVLLFRTNGVHRCLFPTKPQFGCDSDKVLRNVTEIERKERGGSIRA